MAELKRRLTLPLLTLCGLCEKVSSADQFNFMMIENTGVVGVHFGDFLRYVVCADVGAMQEELNAAFQAAAVSCD